MESETKPEAAPAAASRRRLSPKLLIVAGGSTVLLLAIMGGLLAWLWPSAPAKPARHARAAAAAASAASAAASAASAAAAAPAQLQAAATSSAASAAMETTETGEATVTAASAPPAEPAHAQESAPAPAAMAAAQPGSEASLDKLQRRLGEVLGGRGAVNAAQPGEWRVTTRSLAVPVAAPATAHGAVPGAAPSARPAAHGLHDIDWSYAGTNGPQAWGKLHPEFAACANGKRQSPIDIRDGLALDLEAIRFDYRPGAFGIIDNGHTVQVNVAPGSTIEVMGRRYQLQQFHFHRPSEERIDGRRFDMSAHFVHRDAEGRLAVVAVMLERGADLPTLQTVWNNLPLEKGEELRPRLPLDPAQLLPDDRRYYSYMGSLTTPPCSEGVLWLVLQQPVGASPRQIDVFSRLYPMNARPVQRSAGRLIKQSN